MVSVLSILHDVHDVPHTLVQGRIKVAWGLWLELRKEPYL